MIVKINVSKPASYRDDSGGGGKLAENHLGNIFTFLPLTFRQVGSENRRHGPLSFFLPVQYLSPFSLLGKFSIACLGGKWDLPLTTKLKKGLLLSYCWGEVKYRKLSRKDYRTDQQVETCSLMPVLTSVPGPWHLGFWRPVRGHLAVLTHCPVSERVSCDVIRHLVGHVLWWDWLPYTTTLPGMTVTRTAHTYVPCKCFPRTGSFCPCLTAEVVRPRVVEGVSP